MTEEEIARADAAYRQWWLSVLTAGIIPRPEPEPEWQAALHACNGPPKPEPEGTIARLITWLTGKEREAESG